MVDPKRISDRVHTLAPNGYIVPFHLDDQPWLISGAAGRFYVVAFSTKEKLDHTMNISIVRANLDVSHDDIDAYNFGGACRGDEHDENPEQQSCLMCRAIHYVLRFGNIEEDDDEADCITEQIAGMLASGELRGIRLLLKEFRSGELAYYRSLYGPSWKPWWKP